MLRQLIPLSIISLCLTAQAGYAKTIYKSQDIQGETLYTDNPNHKSGEKIVIPETAIQKAPSPKTVAPISEQTPLPTVRETDKIPSVKSYQMVFMAPKNETVFTHDIEEITIKLFLEPELHPDDRIQLIVNDQPMGGFRDSTEFKMDRLNRGQYDLQAFVVSKSGKGKPKGQTEKIRIYQIRQTIHKPF